MRIFRHNASHNDLVDLLYGTPLKKANDQPIFATKRDLLCFAAVLGFEVKRRGEIRAKATEFVDGRPFENSQEAMNLLYLSSII